MIESETILFVDDEELNRELGKDILESLGYNVILASDGLDAINIFKKDHQSIKIVILDMIMPEMNGSETFIKLQTIDKNCKVIISSGYNKDEHIEELLQIGLSGFIHKPYRISDLNILLEKVKSN